MSDEEDSHDGSENSEEDDEVDDDDENSEKAEEILRAERIKRAQEDATLIKDIFRDIEMTSKRISTSLLANDQLKIAADDIKRLEDEVERLRMGDEREEYDDLESEDDHHRDEEESVTWSQYEELSDAQRARLLEKSLQLLSDNAAGRQASHGRTHRGRRGR
jgi:hypothetical protein